MENIDTSSVKLVVRDEHLEEGIPTKNPFVFETFVYLKGNGVQIHMTTPQDQHESDMTPFFKYGDQEYGVRAMVSDHNTPLIGLSDHWKFENRRLSNMPNVVRAYDVARSKHEVLACLLPLRNFIFSEYMQPGSEMMLDDHVRSIKELSNILGERYSFFEMDRTYISDVEACFITVGIIILNKMDQSVLSQELKRHCALLALVERFTGTHLKAVAGTLDLSTSLVGATAVKFMDFLKNECTRIGPYLVYFCSFPPGNEYGVPGGVSIVKTCGAIDLYSSKYWNERKYLEYLKPYGLAPEIIATANNVDVQFVMMKYYSDGNLSSKEEDASLTWIEALRILKRVSYLIYAIHSFLEPEKLVYGDFKPDNFLLDGDRIIICDLASVCLEGEEVHSITTPYLEDVRVGSLVWGERNAHPKGDVYKIGKFIIKLVTRIPIEHPTTKDMVRNLGQVVSAQFSMQSLNDIMRPNMIESGCGESSMNDILNLALRCLNPHLEHRPTASKVADELAVIEEKALQSLLPKVCR